MMGIRGSIVGWAARLEALQNSWLGWGRLLLAQLMVISRSRIRHADDRGVPLLLQLVGWLCRCARVDDDPAGVVVGRVNGEGWRGFRLRLQQANVGLSLR